MRWQDHHPSQIQSGSLVRRVQEKSSKEDTSVPFNDVSFPSILLHAFTMVASSVRKVKLERFPRHYQMAALQALTSPHLMSTRNSTSLELQT